MIDSTPSRRGHSLPVFLGKGVEKFIITAFVVLMLLFTALVYFSDRTANRFLETMIWVDETHDVIDTMKDIELNLREAESALRSYVITGSPAKREEYLRKSSQGLQSGLEKIYKMSSAHKALQDPLARIELLLKPRLELMRESQWRHENGLGEHDENHQKATVAMDNLEQAFQDFAAKARGLTANRIAEREAEAGRLQTISRNSILWGGVFSFFTLTMILLGLYSRRRTELLMRSALEEKNVLLKEIHHRVKNNLQIISSLLILQGNRIKDPEAGRIFLECRERIQFMANLHRQLYATGNFTRIDFGKNLAEISETLIRSHAPSHCKILLEHQIAPLELDIETSQVLGLIASEVLLNTLKHAFKGRSSGTIKVKLSGGVMSELAISDDGVGLPLADTKAKEPRAGIGLVEALAKQIRGQAEITRPQTGGVCFTVRFPPPDLQKETLTRHS